MVDYDVLVGVLYKPTMFVAGLGRNEEVKMARQGVRVLRPTRPAGPIVDLAELNKASPTRDDDLNFALARSAGRRGRPTDSGMADKLPAAKCSTDL